MNFFKAYKPYLILTLVWVVMIIIINPLGEFPQNDDWVFSKDVFLLSEQGQLTLINWSAMSLITQILLGAFFCKIFGFSFTLLRILTLISGLAGLFLTFKVLREAGNEQKIALAATLLIAVNPLFLGLSNTFMTDVYFCTFAAAAFLFFNRALKSGKWSAIIAAAVFTLLATLVRQIGLVLPLAFLITTGFRQFFRNALPLLLSILALFLHHLWISNTQQQLSNYISFSDSVNLINRSTLVHLFNRIGTGGMSLGLFLFPLLILQMPSAMRGVLKKQNLPALLLSALFIIPLIKGWNDFPLGNVFYYFGLGPKLLLSGDHQALSIPDMVALNLMKTIGLIGGILLFYFIFSYVTKVIFTRKSKLISDEVRQEKKTVTFSLLIAVLFFATFILPDFFFDRYLIQLLLPICIIVLSIGNHAKKINKRTLIISYSFIVLYGLLSTGISHDYLSRNRAAWQAAHYIMESKNCLPCNIDGGYEFNGWYNDAAPNENCKNGYTYILSYDAVKDYRTVNKIPYRQYIPFKTSHIYILTREEITDSK